MVLAPLYPIHNSAPSSSSQLTLNYKQLRFSMLFSPQYLAVKDTDLEHEFLFSHLKLTIVVLPPEKQGFLFQYDPSNAKCVTRLCLGYKVHVPMAGQDPPRKCFLRHRKPFPELAPPCTFKLGAAQ